MFTVVSRYTVPPDQMADQAEAHRAWARSHLETGHFVAIGPEVPLQGGIALAVGVTRAEIEEWINEDPYYVHGLVQYEIREYAIVATGPGTQGLQT
jgi:uncharacterized protein YciI